MSPPVASGCRPSGRGERQVRPGVPSDRKRRYYELPDPTPTGEFRDDVRRLRAIRRAPRLTAEQYRALQRPFVARGAAPEEEE